MRRWWSKFDIIWLGPDWVWWDFRRIDGPVLLWRLYAGFWVVRRYT